MTKHLFQSRLLPAGSRHILMMLAFIALMLTGLASCHVLRMSEPEPVQKTTESGITYTILTEGDGPRPREGDIVTVHYTGKLSDGTVFDTSLDTDEPVSFTLGSDELIPGWEEGIMLLREGSKASFVIPPSLAYGEEGHGPVPGGETVSFEVELLRIERPYEPEEVIDDIPEETPEEVAEEVNDRTKTPSGVSYVVLEQGDGHRLDEGMIVELHYTGFLDNDQQTVFDSSHDREQPLSFILGRKMVIPGWEEALPGMKVGDRLRLWVPYEMAYGKLGRGPIPPETDLIFDIEVLDGRTVPSPEPFQTNAKDTIQTESGLKYIIVEEGDGELPPSGSVISVHYTGYLSDGSVFDSSVQRSEPFRFVLGSDQVIRGWDEAFSLLPENTKARLIIPPHLAYGDRGSGPIPPGETLVFDVEVVDISK